MSIKRRLYRTDQGDEYDIHRAWTGGLDTAWSRRKRQARVSGGSVVTIGVNSELSSSEHADTQFWRGAAAIRMADILTEAGYHVRIVTYNAGCDVFPKATVKNILQTVEIKRADMPLDIPTLTAAIAQAGTFRHYGIHHYTSFPWIVHGASGYPIKSYELPGVDALVQSSTVFDQATATAWLERTVIQFNNRLAMAA